MSSPLDPLISTVAGDGVGHVTEIVTGDDVVEIMIVGLVGAGHVTGIVGGVAGEGVWLQVFVHSCMCYFSNFKNP